MSKIKVLFVLPSLRGGGAERVILTLLKGLDVSKFQSELVLLEKTGNYVEDLLKNLKVYALNKKKARFAIFSLARFLTYQRPKILFTTLPQINALGYLSLKISHSKPFWIIRRANYEPPQILPFLTKFFLKKSYQKADKIVCVSKGLAKDLAKYWHISEKKINVIPNPIDIDNIQNLAKSRINHPWFYSQTPIIVAVGRLTGQKGFSFLIKAFSQVLSQFKAKLVILGQGPEKETLEQLTREFRVEREVEFLGFQNNPYPYIARAQVFVLSSLWEGFPNVLVEAMACGVPVVATDCPFGPREILEDGKYGLLVPPANEEALAKAILKILESPQLAKDFSEKAKERVKNFAKEKVIKEYENLFLEVFQKKNVQN